MAQDLRSGPLPTGDPAFRTRPERQKSVTSPRVRQQRRADSGRPGLDRPDLDRLDLDKATVRRARSLARTAGAPIVRLARTHTTVSVERAVLRLAGATGADPDGIPWVNRLVDVV